MGCMYDGRPINGQSGVPGIAAGETMILPYHVGHLLAQNLAKRVLNTSPAATLDPAGIPTGVPVWSPEILKNHADSYIKELYTEEKAAQQSETDKLMAKVEEYKKLVEEKLGIPTETNAPEVEVTEKVETTEEVAQPMARVFQDKQEVIAELEKRNIKFDRRASKANLEMLLA
jgi:hypothetical protein